MNISEIFLSIQGESSFIGKPTVFVRFYGCNMRCTYCDSKYAVEGGEFEVMSLVEVVGAVEKFGRVGHVCLTGGEPTLQKELPDLISILVKAGQAVSIETDGGIDLQPFVQLPCHIVMDVKLSGSGMHGKMRWKNLDILRPGLDQIKFVILGREDYMEAKQVIYEHRLDGRGFELLMSPVVREGTRWSSERTDTTGLEYRHLADWILEDRLPVRFNPQLHKFIWPDRHRGV